jgi:16S rRNA (guanine527-N7)-methyltransferase
LIEPRRLRVEFLHKVAEELQLDVNILPAKAERVAGAFDVITARAVAPLGTLLELSLHLSTRNSRWVLPKGRNAESEVAQARRSWQGTFHVERSLTDEDSGIVVATDVKAKRI